MVAYMLMGLHQTKGSDERFQKFLSYSGIMMIMTVVMTKVAVVEGDDDDDDCIVYVIANSTAISVQYSVFWFLPMMHISH